MRTPFFLPLFLFLLFAQEGSFAQGSWTQLADFPGSSHFAGSDFKIGETIYFLEGHNSSTCSDRLWKFDASTGSWTQKASFPGNLTKGNPVGFAIDSTGYIGTGKTCSDNTGSAFWSYDASSDSWQKMSDIPGAGIQLSIAFSINGKGYIGLGRFSAGNPNDALYEYDPASDSWTQKASFPSTGTSSKKAVVIGSKAYVATGGSTGNSGNRELWSYDPNADSWTQLISFPGAGRRGAIAFNISHYFYIGMGWDGSNYFSDFYRFNAKTKAWKQIPDFGGIKRRVTEGFAAGDTGYVVAGKDYQGNYRKDVWAYRPSFLSQKGFEKEGASFSVRPNPARERVRIEFGQEAHQEASLRLYSSKGELIRNEQVQGTESSMDLSELSSGIYFLELKEEEKVPQRKKLILE